MGFLAWALGVGVPWLSGLACVGVAGLSRIYLEPLMPTLGRIVTTLILAVAVMFAGYGYGFEKARNACNAQAIQTRLDRALMDLSAAKRAAEIAANSVEQLNAAEARNQELVDALANRPAPQPEVPAQPDAAPAAPAGPARDVCNGLSPADVGGLLRIR